MNKLYFSSIVIKTWRVALREVLKVDRVLYLAICAFMIIIPVALYHYGSWWADSERICHSRFPEECFIAWSRFIPFVILCISQVAILIIFADNLQGMLRNFLNPEYEALKRNKDLEQ